ncbi:hypothetical protein AAFC00_003529 [Neodothiora populina]
MASSSSRQPTHAQHQAPPGSILLVVHDFVARSPDELSLAKGDRIELIERDDDFGDGWFLGRHMTNGTTGLFPEVYTTPAPKATLPVSSNQQRTPRLGPLSPTLSSLPAEQHASASSRPSSGAAPPSAAQFDGNGNANVHARYSGDLSNQRPLSSSGNGIQDATRSSLSANPPSTRTTQSLAPQHNSVMHETLSVIDEHITDLRTPRQSHLSTNRSNQDADSVYSHDAHRLSYINGHETDEEEEEQQQQQQQHLHTESEVMAWTPARVAQYLEQQGVEKQHCDIFREQEISGEVILHMEQSAVFIKEFELGSVGRRLKTWQKIKALQDETRAAGIPGMARSISDYSAAADDSMSMNEVARTRSASITVPPQRPSTAAPVSSSFPTSAGFATQPSPALAAHLQSLNSITARPESMARPSAASIRSLNHSRRHSSLGSIGDAAPPPATSRYSQHRQSSSGASPLAIASAAAASRRRSSVQEQPHTSIPQHSDHLSVGNYGFANPDSPGDIDRGYFSGNEVENRNKRNVLQKRSSQMHARNASAVTDSARHSTQFRSHGRVASVESMRAPVSPILSPESAQFSFDKAAGHRAVSSPLVTTGTKPFSAIQEPASPIVTKLEYGQSSITADSDASSANYSPSPASHSFTFFSKPRVGGLRVASDAVTQNEKRAQSNLKGSPITSPTRTGSTTPSTDTPSIEIQKPDTQSRVSTGSSSLVAPPPPAARARPKTKTKKSTSAYTRGLEKRTPAEQMTGCDYSGWMKKKSSNLMGSWKPRLFVLRGRRLSYYYSENDTEEKGLIDISSHRVLPAENERMTGLHAALTGASSSPVMPANTTTQTSAATDLASKPSIDSETGLFIFKLVPPRQGLSKAVNFTKPAVHYFAVNSRQEGRLWMAALMKATIDYDPSGKVVTSYNQKTISLAKARARNERPPALREISNESATEDKAIAELDGGSVERPDSSVDQTGLGIDGIESSKGDTDPATTGGAEKSDAVTGVRTSST